MGLTFYVPDTAKLLSGVRLIGRYPFNGIEDRLRLATNGSEATQLITTFFPCPSRVVSTRGNEALLVLHIYRPG
jgi:hypothetical protein